MFPTVFDNVAFVVDKALIKREIEAYTYLFCTPRTSRSRQRVFTLQRTSSAVVELSVMPANFAASESVLAVAWEQPGCVPFIRRSWASHCPFVWMEMTGHVWVNLIRLLTYFISLQFFCSLDFVTYSDFKPGLSKYTMPIWILATRMGWISPK